MNKVIVIVCLMLMVGCSNLKTSSNSHREPQHNHIYNNDGTISQTVIEVDGVEVETLKYKYYVDGSVKSLVRFKQGIKHGESIRYFQDGSIKRSTQWVHGKRSGKETAYYENGKVWYNHELLNGVIMNGFRYDKNGNLINKSQFVKDQGQKETQYLYKNGKMISEKKFLNGKLIMQNGINKKEEKVASE